MVDNFLNWFARNRILIGYMVGSINLLNGFMNLHNGRVFDGIFWLIMGAIIVLDTKEFK
jgi:hypothetical protein